MTTSTTTRRQRRREQEQERSTLALLTDMAQQERHRIGGAARHGIDAADVAADAWLRLAEHDAATLATLTAGAGRIDDAAMADAARRARMVTRSVVANTAERLTMATEAEAPREAPTMAEALAQSAAPCPVCQGPEAERLTCDAARMADRRQRRGTTAWHAVHAAIVADGPAQRADRDGGRGYVIRDGGRRHALTMVAEHGGGVWQDGATRDGGAVDGAAKARKRAGRTMGRRIAEQTIGGPAHDAKGTVRLLREAPLASLLSDAMRTGSDRMVNHDAAPDRVWRAEWMAEANRALRAVNVGGRRGSHRAALAEALRRAEDGDRIGSAGASRRAGSVHAATLAMRAEAARVHAIGAEDHAQRLTAGDSATLRTADGSPRSATAAEMRAARTAALAASEAAEDAATVLAIWRTATDGGRRPFSLLAALLATVDVAAHENDRGASLIHWRTLALAIGADASKRGQEALRDFVRDAIGGMVVGGARDRQRAASEAQRRAGAVGASQRQRAEAERLTALAVGSLAIVRQRAEAEREAEAEALASARATFRGAEAHRAARHAARMAQR